MNLSHVRALVRQVLLEDEEALKRWAVDHGNSIESELAKLDIIPLHRDSKQTSQLGAGMYNVALDVVYNGKRAVARYSKNRKELQSLLDFVKISETMDQKYRKHFPKIYKTFDFATDTQEYYGAVVELLDEIPPAIKFDLDAMSLSDNLQRSRVQALLSNDQIPISIAQHATSTPAIHDELLSMYNTSIKPKLESWIGKSLYEFDSWLNDIIEIEALSSKEDGAFYRFHRAINRVLRGTVIPTTASNSAVEKALPKTHVSSKVREFYEFLEALNDEGVAYDDLHTDNFMVRRGTNDFVVVDPGFFESH